LVSGDESKNVKTKAMDPDNAKKGEEQREGEPKLDYGRAKKRGRCDLRNFSGNAKGPVSRRLLQKQKSPITVTTYRGFQTSEDARAQGGAGRRSS